MRDNLLAEQGLQLLDQGRFGEAKVVFENLVAHVAKQGTTAQHAWALKSLATAERRAANLEQALDHINAAYSLAAPLGDPVLIAEIRAARGNIRSELGQTNGALEDLRHSLRTYDRLGHTEKSLQVFNNLAVCLARAGKFGQARQAFKDVLALARTLGDERAAAQAHNNLGLLCMEEGDLASAEQHFMRDLSYCRQAGDLYGEAAAHANLGELYSKSASPHKARSSFEQAAGLFERSGARRELSNVRNRLRSP